MNKEILVINPGSTSTKVAVYNGQKEVYLKNIRHEISVLSGFKKIADQFDYRKSMILDDLKQSGFSLENFSIIAGRGGSLKPIEGGVYRVNDVMLHDIKNPMGEHESNLGGAIANAIAQEIGNGVYAIIVDPTCVDEMQDVARITGMPELTRISFLHALNQKVIARTYAGELSRKYEDLKLIVAHLGGGISIGAHSGGRIIDVNNALNGDGPMTPERSGGVPAGPLVELCFSGKFTIDEILKKLKGQGGLLAYLRTSDAQEIEQRINSGDKKAELVFTAMAYQISKEIGALSTVLKGKVDGILLTGGLAYSELLINMISERIAHLGEIKVYPGEGEMKALAFNALMVLNNEIEVKEYV
jgi:butyrate kinase